MAFLQSLDRLLRKIFENKITKNKTFNVVVLALLFFTIIFSSFYTTVSPKKYDLKVGQIAPSDIRAPQDIEDKEATAKAIEKAIKAVEPREEVDPTIQINIKNKIEVFFKNLYELKDVHDTTTSNFDEIVDSLDKYNEFDLSKSDLRTLLKSKEDTLKNFEGYTHDFIVQVMTTGIKEQELDNKKEKIQEYFMALEGISDNLKSIGIKIVNNSIKENIYRDEKLTQERINEAIKNVDKIFIYKGQLIVEEGEEITEKHYKFLVEAGLINKENNKDIKPFIGVVIIILLLELILISYIYFFNNDLTNKISNLYLVTLIFLMSFLLSKPLASISSYLIPIAASSMLIGILINPTVAIVLNIFLAILITLATNNSIIIFVTLLTAGTVAAISASNTHQRSGIFVSGLLVSLTNLILIVGFGLTKGFGAKDILINGFYGILNGVFCSILTIGSLPLWEYIFNMLTPIKLLELSNPNHPILKRLLVEAPGTYHHSIIVGNLSESAAQAIGCNSLLARVGSYYHDIGKLKRPYFFKENQLTSDNPHDKISPYLSSNIIRSHVQDGVKLAYEHKIPKDIIDIIEQHHGDTLVKYFYHKAMNENDQIKDVDPNDFKYRGPTPKSKEAAIVMLADSVEAAVRSLSEPTRDNIEELVKKIIEGKNKEDQLHDCDLTFKDLETIRKTFINILMGIFHERIEYPEIDNEGLEASR
ncbi:HD family phosphohydrolase [Wukongibacter sp. M2B1]|uniref:HD family phosphohydrolase n=1 Tax=Wukongibacter sp. M2B1 TaxID=3088895 RepID=UPI003D7B99B6